MGLGIFTYIYHIFKPNVGKYSIHGTYYGIHNSTVTFKIRSFGAIFVFNIVIVRCQANEQHEDHHETSRPTSFDSPPQLRVLCMLGTCHDFFLEIMPYSEKITTRPDITHLMGNPRPGSQSAKAILAYRSL